ncbi:MAG: hypothetical protein R2882_09800 [Gemmatimonadales bacterium]
MRRPDHAPGTEGLEPDRGGLRDGLHDDDRDQLLRAARSGGPADRAGATAGIEQFLFTPFDSFLYAVDILGYSFMSLATLFAAGVFTGGGRERVVRGFLLANGLLIPFISLQMYVHWLIWIAALWAITFPGATWSLAALFRGRGNRRSARSK